MPLQATSGAASYDAFGGGVAVVPTYIEDVFSTWLYTGTSANQTITNNIDLSTNGGLVWIKSRSNDTNHALFDTARGTNKYLRSNATDAETTASPANSLTAFNTNGFSLGSDTSTEIVNYVSRTYVSWSLRKQPKFFDIVTYTGTGANRTIAHNLGSAPGCMIIKKTNAAKDWAVYHRGLGNTKYITLNSTSAQATSSSYWNNTDPTSTVFTVGIDGDVNANGDTYVAYLFAHDAGGFGLTGTDNVISCGAGTSNGSGVINAVTLGYEPQFVIAKATGTTSQWFMLDTMRGDSLTSISYLQANTSDAETTTTTTYLYPTATGFAGVGNFFGANQPFIYIAIRRGPMKVPTTGTSVFAPVTGSFSSPYTVTTNFPVDLTISGRTAGATMTANDRLRGGTTNSYAYLNTRATDAESTGTGAGLGFQSNTAVIDTNWQTGGDAIWWNWRRSPSFMDVVCYSGTGSVRTVSHNLAAVPELMIVKARANARNWIVYSASTGNAGHLILNDNSAYAANSADWDNTSPTSSVFTVGGNYTVNDLNAGMVAYLFATCSGVSKVGSYTGTATTKQIDCGFTAGARFVLIKRTDSTGDWYVWDSARGIVAGNDPYILINNSPQVTTTDYIDTYSAGFEISSTAPAAINASGGTYIFLAIA